jgi:Xaa-Pro aminopeptidase
MEPHQARAARMERTRAAMEEAGVDALVLSQGADLPWLTGYWAMPLERLTALVLDLRRASLVVPRLEAPLVPDPGGLFELRPWRDSEDPLALVARLLGGARRVGVSERTWASALLGLQALVPGASWVPAGAVLGPLRARKDPLEQACLRAAARAADRVAAALLAGEVPLIGRTEAEVSRELGDRLLAEGHQRVNFAIVASGPNAASPHHRPGRRRIGPGEPVVCDFGGVLGLGDGPGYCSDITRTVVTGPPDPELARAYEVLRQAQAASVASVRPGLACEEVDAAAREPLARAGLGDLFIHRTGHGIGLEEHEEPYIVEGNRQPLCPGHAFSVEPGIYLEGRFGARVEDIVVVTDGGAEVLNHADRDLAVVEA